MLNTETILDLQTYEMFQTLLKETSISNLLSIVLLASEVQLNPLDFQNILIEYCKNAGYKKEWVHYKMKMFNEQCNNDYKKLFNLIKTNLKEYKKNKKRNNTDSQQVTNVSNEELKLFE